jgi:cysteine desulfurase
MIYLDAAATTPVRREVLEAMWPFLTNSFGNPSSHHSLGDEAARALKSARERVAVVLGCRPNEIIFTSGGTEADNLALKGIALANPRGHRILTTPIEHEAVLASCDYLHRHHNFTIDYLPIDRAARVRPADLAEYLQEHPDTTLVSVMLANNEVGTTQPIEELAQLCRNPPSGHSSIPQGSPLNNTRAIPFHTDAVQACGSLPIHIPTLQADALSLSGHKLGAPKGIGVLYLRSRIPAEPVLHGGGQERNRRSGTENVAGAVAFATALELTAAELPTRIPHLTTLRDRLIGGILAAVPDAILTGHPTQRLPNHASFCFPRTSGEAVLLQLEERGILCSSGSACAAGSDEPSHVLTAMGYPRDVAQTAVRFTLTHDTTLTQIEETIARTREAVIALTHLASSF